MTRLIRILSVGLTTLSLPVVLSANTLSPSSPTVPVPMAQSATPSMLMVHGGGMRRSKHRRSDRLLSELGLSDAQRDQIFQIRHNAVPVMRQHRQAVRQARRDLRQAAFSDHLDQARIDEIISRMTSAKMQIAKLRAQSDHQVFQILDTAQRDRLRELLEKKRRI